MPAFFLELFSEEIPARMQARGAEDLARLVGEALAPLGLRSIRTYSGPRRIALGAEMAAGVQGSRATERGPRASAPEAALAGFLRKHGAAREQLRVRGEYWVLERVSEAVGAATLIAAALPPLLRRFPWPKSMRWGGTSAFAWVRPLHRITCLLDGEVVPFDLRDGDDDGHGLASGNLTEGHRFLSPGPFAVRSREDWAAELRGRHVLVDAAERKRVIADGVADLAAGQQLAVVEDPGLLDEVTGLVEWPVPLLGRIDPAYMDLPAEVMQVSMRANQRYFALRSASGEAAPFFAFVANTEPVDGGRITIDGNERVLRARFADARHFWDLDRRTPLADRVPALDAITFHAKLGSQGDRVRRLERLSETIAPLVGADPTLARRAAHLAKADLVTGMVGEFPELQGVMGRYYALHAGEPPTVADAIRDHYSPKGPNDPTPNAPISTALALADKLDMLAAFFSIGEKPTGSGDPYALRRAALGVIQAIRQKHLRLSLRHVLGTAIAEVLTRAYYRSLGRRDEAVENLKRTGVPHDWADELSRRVGGSVKAFNPEDLLREANANGSFGLAPVLNDVRNSVLRFVIDRLLVQLRAEGARHDVLAAVFAAGADDDINRLLARTEALAALLGTDDGVNLLTAHRRAANILRIEDRKDGPHEGAADPASFRSNEERAVAAAIETLGAELPSMLATEQYSAAMSAMARLRPPLDAFFDHVTVNAPEPDLRRNRLRLLSSVRSTMDRVADFSRIEG